ncbi:MAG: methyltransferase domain-containing protein [Kangiellaceae bacterium]|jgi:tRNA G46 methylase TrmB|nr:methyltransferase domain-containing protein [Kangiellaceae bacterium]
MKNNSKPIETNQQGLNENLTATLVRHQKSTYRKPIQQHNQQAFESFIDWLGGGKDTLILDSCCGTGLSTAKLARLYPNHKVVGVDQSKFRLSKQSQLPDNGLLVRANCEDFWRLCQQNKIVFEKHFILYPNPWPKAEHLKRRWHGHPVFPVLPELARETQVRSNWPLYLEEFALAWQFIGQAKSKVIEFSTDDYLTLFEKKYSESDHTLYRVTLQSKLC